MGRLVQLVLDLFGSPPPADPTPIDPLAPPALPIEGVCPKAVFAHPRANRRIALPTCEIAYAFARSRRRTIGMLVGPEGLEVRAPRWVGWAEIESALLEKSDWIYRKLQETQANQARLMASRIVWQDGANVPYLGEPLRIVLDSGLRLRRGSAQFEAAALEESAVLRLGLPTHADGKQIREATQAWLMGQARALFEARLQHFAPQLGVQWQRLSLSSASTRWGSASADGRIRLNWRLIHHRLPVIDYVVAHELSHLRVMDHSPRFWDTVEQVVPDYAVLRQTLRDHPLPPWD